MEEETQFVPFVIHIAQSDAAWLAAWAPDPRALGAHAMGLAALRGLLAEDMPKDGQPLGGEIQHARALIENARHANTPIKGVTDDVESVQLLRQRINDFGKDRARDSYRMETAFTYVENLEKRIAAVEEANAGMAHRLVGFGPPLQRIAALEEKAVRVSAEWRDRLAETNQRISGVENRCALLENDAESAAGRIAALEESREASVSVAGDHSRKLIGLLERIKEVEAEQTNAAGDIGKLKNRTANLEMRWEAKS